MIAEYPTAIVTGASSGIGRQTSILLASAGYHLILVARDPNKLDQTVDLARKTTPHDIDVEVLSMDLSDPRSGPLIAAKAGDRFGRIDAVANVAGYCPMMTIQQVTPDEWTKVIDTNLSCIVHLTRAVWPILSQQNGGTIVNVSSITSVDPLPNLAIYATAKAAVNTFTYYTAEEGNEVGIQAVAIAPGAVETPMLRSQIDEQALSPAQTLDPKTVAQMIVDCITGKQSFEPGQTILMPSEGLVR
ncbi:MAG: SDR family NAD(P)-dependent oxidoreductase [Gammaproteobacteria bacterium]|nr:SDR family NAD(P)-dependent oxidoreductase [Gammaproteobacteria bacterium]